MTPCRTRRWALVATLVTAPALAAQEPVDSAAIRRLYDESMTNGKVMEIASWLTDVHGPRLTGSPGARTAADWTVRTLAGYGLRNVGLEWFEQPRFPGWRNDRFSLQAVAPVPFPVIAAPRAWSPGTAGLVRGDAVFAPMASWADTARFAGTLRGKFVMVTPVPTLAPRFTPDGRRFTDAELQAMASWSPDDAPAAGGRRGAFPAPAANAFRPTADTAALRWLERQGAAGILMAARGDMGTVFTDNGAPRAAGAPQVPAVHVSAEHYGRMARILEKGETVTLELLMQNTTTPEGPSFNIVGEIPGTDPKLRDEVVVIGAHFDSWHAGTGATDNAAGTAVMMEAMRLIQSLGMRPRRTIRIGLWTGEEQGIHGSRAYVSQHLATRVTRTDSAGRSVPTDTVRATPAYARHAGYFNVDNGTGRIRGVYLQGNAAVRDIFGAWIAPLRDKGVTTLTLQNTGGTDHLPFDGVGLTGWQFIQDPVEYSTRTHHSNQDVFERLVPEDMKHNAAVVAAFAWQAAQRDRRLPSKPGTVVVPAPAPAAARRVAGP